MKNNLGKAHRAAYSMVEVIEKDFDSAWRKKVVQLQVPMFSQSTKGTWLLRFDDVLTDALELGPLRNNSFDLPAEILNRIEEHRLRKVPVDVITTLVKYNLANKPEGSDLVVLPVTNFDACFGSTTFSKKWKHLIPDSLIIREGERMGVTKYRVAQSLISAHDEKTKNLDYKQLYCHEERT